MDPVSNANRITILLRQKLLERSKATASQQSRPKGEANRAGMRPIEAVEERDRDGSSRAVVESLLAAHFGTEMINEAAFQQVVDQVTETLEADAEGRNILAKGVADFGRH